MKILIIGAGVSGIAAASKLFQYGITDFMILEAQNRIGGRIHTENFAGSTIDFGAQWCHGIGHIVYNLAGKDSFDETKMDFRNMIFSRGEQVDNKNCTILMELLNKVLESTKYEGGKESVENFLRRKYFDELKKSEYKNIDGILAREIFENFVKRECSYSGCDSLNEISIENFNKFKECSGPTWLNWKGKGYSTIFNHLIRNKFNLMDKVLMNKKVLEIDYSSDCVTVKCEDGSKYSCDIVIVTVSLGVLKVNHKSLFIPQLPSSKVEAIENLNFGAVGKIFIEFDHQFWSDDFLGLSLLWNDKNRAKISSTNSWIDAIYCIYKVDYTKNILLARISGDKVREIEELSEERITSGCEYIFDNFMPKNLKVGKIISVKTSKWKTNENFYGTYSYYGNKNVSLKALEEPLHKDGKLKVLFAGEAFHEVYFSTVHGAIETGFNAAKMIKENYNLKSKF